MVIGVHGVVMENAQKLVVLVHRSGDVRVINLQCQMVEKGAMGQDMKLENVTSKIVQVLQFSTIQTFTYFNLMNLDSLLICHFWLREWFQDFLNQILIRVHAKIKNDDHARIV